MRILNSFVTSLVTFVKWPSLRWLSPFWMLLLADMPRITRHFTIKVGTMSIGKHGDADFLQTQDCILLWNADGWHAKSNSVERRGSKFNNPHNTTHLCYPDTTWRQRENASPMSCLPTGPWTPTKLPCHCCPLHSHCVWPANYPGLPRTGHISSPTPPPLLSPSSAELGGCWVDKVRIKQASVCCETELKLL